MATATEAKFFTEQHPVFQKGFHPLSEIYEKSISKLKAHYGEDFGTELDKKYKNCYD
jgi:hypothetical protein